MKTASDFAKEYLSGLKGVLDRLPLKPLDEIIRVIEQARDEGRQIFVIGNGGSAATATHFANDLGIGTRSLEHPFRVVSLTDNLASISAIANDFGYEHIFAQQVRVLGKKGDVLVAISASGNSPNLLTAFEAAKGMGIRTVALTAFDGGKLKQVADQGIHVPTAPKEYGPAEDAHMILDHLVHAYLCRLIHP